MKASDVPFQMPLFPIESFYILLLCFFDDVIIVIPLSGGRISQRNSPPHQVLQIQAPVPVHKQTTAQHKIRNHDLLTKSMSKACMCDNYFINLHFDVHRRRLQDLHRL